MYIYIKDVGVHIKVCSAYLGIETNISVCMNIKLYQNMYISFTNTYTKISTNAYHKNN